MVAVLPKVLPPDGVSRGYELGKIIIRHPSNMTMHDEHKNYRNQFIVIYVSSIYIP